MIRRAAPAAAIALVVGFAVPLVVATAPADAAAPSVPRPDHVVIVVDENHSENSVLGNPNAPYINSLAASGANLTGFYAETHPSQPNYLALFSGSTQGVTDDSCPQTFTAANLGSELIAAGLGFTGYSEDLPSVGFTGCGSGAYARKHNPWSDFSNVPASASQPFTVFPADYSTLPPVSFVIPNLNDDMHDGTIAQGDTWLQTNLAGYVTWAQTHNSVFVLTFDEDDGSQQNQIPTIITGAGVVAGNYPETINHYNLLRTIEDAYGLTPVGASATANPITDIWSGGTGNKPPTASYTWSCMQLNCSFDGTASSDPDGVIASYQWDFGDGSSGTGATPSHTFTTGGSYPVKLTVTDNQGATASITHTITATAGTPFVSDAFNRSVANGLGAADIGGTWSTVGTASNFSVSAGAAKLALPKAATQDEGYVGPAQTDADVATTVSADRVPVGGPLYLTVTGRRVGSNNRYGAQVLCNSSGTVSIGLQRVVSGATTALTSKTVAGLACAAASPLRIRLQVTGTNPTALNAKVWPANATEPSAWQVTASDSTAVLQAPGTVGTIAYLSSAASNAPVNVALSAFVASSTGPPPNQPPTASFTSSCMQLACNFDGSGSSDPDGTIASYAWNFGDGATGSGVKPTHAFVASGTYPVTLTVTDNQGATSSVSHSVTVTAPPPNQPPTAVFTSNCTNLQCSFDGSGSSDPDGTIASYTWDFGDGVTGSGATPSHTYATAGTYTVKLTVTDNQGATNTVSHNVTVTAPPNIPPTAVFTSNCTNLQCSFDGSQSNDQDGSIAGYSWDFGDNTAAGSGASPNHTYAQAGTYSVKLTVTDNKGATNSVSHNVVVTAPPNQPPNALFSFSCPSLQCSFDGSQSNDPDGSIASYGWDFGDNSAAGSGGGPNHTYAAAGTYTVKLTVTDNQGATNSVSHDVTVTAPANQPPVAAFTPSCTNLGCSFDGSGSHDPDGSIASYAWSFGDGDTGTGVGPSESYPVAGDYTVTLTVTDNQGATNSVSHVVSPRPAANPPSAPYATDGFNRTVASGWGSADTGGAWSVSSAAKFSVAGGVGSIVMSTAASQPSVYLNSLSSTDTDTTATLSTDKAGTGNGIYLEVMGRRLGASSDYQGRLRITSSNTVAAALLADNAGTATTLKAETALPGVSYTPGMKLKVRFQVTGTNPTTLRFKAWPASGAEPNAWLLTATDNTAALQAPGSVGLQAYLSGTASNAPVTESVANFATAPTVAPPTAAFTASCGGLACSVDGTASTDPSGTISTWQWSWADGTVSTGKTSAHTYTNPGTYRITLTVTDPSGWTDVTTRTITVPA